jgi:cell division septation protein DedD
MAADDYHNNNFIFKTITVFRIVVGVAVTLAVLFTMVWLIDYSSDRPASTYNQQTLLLPDHDQDKKSQQTRTFFESLLNKKTEKKEDVFEAGENIPESVPRQGVTKRSKKPESSSVVRTTEPPVAVTRPQAAQSTRRPAVQSPAIGDVFAVQLGSFQQVERARIFSENLAAKGYQPYILNSAMPDGTMTYRVRIGRFVTREEAMSLAARIEAKEKISVFVTAK